jgi:hypothetical protein
MTSELPRHPPRIGLRDYLAMSVALQAARTASSKGGLRFPLEYLLQWQVENLGDTKRCVQ